MINKRLVRLLSDGKKYIYGNIFFQWINLIANIVAIFLISGFISDTYYGNVTDVKLVRLIVILAIAVLTRVICNVASSKMSYLSSKKVKQVLRHKIMEKMLTLGSSYNEKVRTSEVVQVSVEGVEQIETYFGLYLPQLFYSLLAPLTLFAVIVFMSFTPAIVLLLCVPLIPISIAAVQTFAKKLLAKYWGKYTGLGDTFLENLQGLTTLKIYQADEYKNKKMNEEAEEFRKITMKVLTMQLNSITIMDIVAYGGAALGIILTVKQFVAGNIRLDQAIAIILLSADFFIPMRQLGSFFHIAMNGMAAIDKIFKILDLEVPEEKTMSLPGKGSIKVENLSFAYDESHNVLNDISIELLEQGMVSLVGASGSGKSTMASLLMKRSKNYSGKIFVGEVDFNEISEKSVMENITYISHSSYIFKGSVRDNLLMAKADAKDKELWDVLKKTNLADFFEADNGLDFEIAEAGGNLSGGQKQRLALARGLLHDSRFYIFDESTSNIDVESEEVILEQIKELAKHKGVLMISHRLANVVSSDKIFVLEKGQLKEEGTHEELLAMHGTYSTLWETQQSLENMRGV
ncbi:cysteine ABC transporter ATP-binding protein [Eubacterium sulci ATCC 35585]|nr:cysteine ABC transporter ATP-binding protein [Eubacterium sulci ATCC 35585]EUC77845.1 ABC transporter, ATP-binding protein [Eubacterium sulci ATCC 35585]